MSGVISVMSTSKFREGIKIMPSLFRAIRESNSSEESRNYYNALTKHRNQNDCYKSPPH